MATQYATIQQYEPPKVPANWGAAEKRFVSQLLVVLDDIYRRFGRLQLADLSNQLGKKITDASDNSQLAVNSAQQAVADINNLEQYIKIVQGQDGGIYLTDQNKASTMRITSAAVEIGTVDGDEANGFSQFAANYVRFGDYYIRRTRDGGLAFSRG